jgi:hypothetical protein
MTSRSLWLWPACLCLAALVAWVYWPGLAGPPMLDDRANLAVLADIDDDPAYLADIVLGNHSSSLGRPLAMLSFGLEKLCCDAGLRGIKRTNLLLHIGCGLVLLLLARALLGHLQLPATSALVLLLTAFWMLSPLWVSTVLYAVQRMAQLSALFVLAGLLVYSQWRIALIAGRSRHWLLLLLAVCGLCGYLAKENALLLWPLVLVLECYVFLFMGPGGEVFLRARRVALFSVVAAATGLLAVAWMRPDVYTGSYHLRDFSMIERVLTQARVLWDYLGQIGYPDLRHMGVFHDDYPVSSSLLEPLSTAWAVVGWLLVAVAGLAGLYWRTLGLVVFGLVFFLVGHALESSVFALELYFEHRNYLPATGLFIGGGILAGLFLDRFPQSGAAFVALGGALVLLLALRTSSQTMVWSNAYLLHMGAVNAHPQSIRANTEYAGYLARVGFLSEALVYSRRAAALDVARSQGVTASRELVLHCLANQPLPEALPGRFALTTDDIELRSAGDALQVLVELIENGKCPALDAVALADRFAGIFLSATPAPVPSTQVFLALALLENHLRRPANGFAYTARLLDRGAKRPQVYLMHLNFAITLDNVTAADEMDAWLRAADERGALDRQQRDTWQLHLR